MGSTSRLIGQYYWLLSIPLLIFGFWAEWQDFVLLWYDSIIYSHGYLVLAGILFLLYLRRHKLATLTINGSPLALLLLAAASAVLLFAQAADVRFVRLILVPVLIVLWGWSIWGRGFPKVAGGPILLMLYAAPIWDDLSPLLQHITVFFNDILLKFVDIQATIKEFYIVLDVGTFYVAGGCSGVRYLMVGLFLATFYGQLYYRSHLLTLLLVIFAGLLSMFANWLRVFGVIAAGHYTDMETSLIENHEAFGWGVFIVFTLIPLFYISSKLEAHFQNDDDSAKAAIERPRPRYTSAAWPVISSLLILWPAIIPLVVDAKTRRVSESWNPELVETNSDWRGPLPHANIWQPEYQNYDIELSGVYVSSDLRQVQLHITGYRRQTQNKELIYFGNKLFNQKKWQLVSTTKRDLANRYSAAPTRVNETIIQDLSNGSQVILWSWYDVGGVLTDSKIEAKVAGALNKIFGDSRGALWVLAGRCDGDNDSDCEQQRAVFNRFLASTE
ncbi:exosortase A [uncultured Marinobacter sp.]|uniref:exosortase A n=1 Tax=uncultured Marinobacter sp. TaxID=187379 RepID=UPI002623F150|nr:exosortase A [uncultured Marinobacter sp.]